MTQNTKIQPDASVPELDLDATMILPAQVAARLRAEQDQTAGTPSHTSFPATQGLQHPTLSASSTPYPSRPSLRSETSMGTTAPANTDNTAGLLPQGSHVAEFEIVRLIGQGGFGVVYEAWDHTLERVVAIKEYMPSSLASRQADGNIVPLSERHKDTFDAGMRSFINEARLLAQFDHPALLKVYRFWQERGTTYMVMPLYQGPTLKQALSERKGKVEEPWLLEIIDGVTQALAVMHKADCYHRDIAPDNILLQQGTGAPVVLDFGAARRVITDMTQAITVILKPGYAPIEQYSETPDMKQGAWTDVYALCAVMYSALTGHPPPPSVARMINDRCIPLAGDAALIERFKPHVLEAIDAGLAVMPDKRLPSMGALRAALGLALDGSAEGAGLNRPSSVPLMPPATITFSRKMPIWLPLSLGGGLLAVGLVGWIFLSSKPESSGSSTSAAPALSQSAKIDPNSVQAPAVPVAPATPVSALDSLVNLTTQANSQWRVEAKPVKESVQIGKDKLSFSVRSNKAGFVYVYLLSSSGDMYLLFPNALDKRHQVTADTEITLPRPSWAMEAGGPEGINEFAVVVSDREMDMGSTGFRFDGVFAKFPPPVLAAMEAARGSAKSPLLGTPICVDSVNCSMTYGAIRFKISEK